jgi:hypothetical protein
MKRVFKKPMNVREVAYFTMSLWAATFFLKTVAIFSERERHLIIETLNNPL